MRAIPCRDWVELIENEYLKTFVREGGSAIKFAVPDDDRVRAVLFDKLRQVAGNLNYVTVEVDAKDTRMHMMHEIFFKIAEQINWESLAREVVIRIAEEMDLTIPANTSGGLLESLAEQNGGEPRLLRGDLYRALSDTVYRNRGLAKDFRVAMIQLCRAQLSGGPDGEHGVRVLMEWLTGRNRRVSAVRPYLIFSTINRTNARFMFESLLNWLRFLGYTGLLALLDISRVTTHPNPRDGNLYYSRSALLDAYEVLRQFIDSTGKMQGCLILVSPEMAFVDQETFGRGFGAYEALKFRIMDEVRDRELVNPMSSLVPISG